MFCFVDVWMDEWMDREKTGTHTKRLRQVEHMYKIAAGFVLEGS